MLLKEIGERIQKIRIQNGLNKKEFAAFLNITPRTLGAWEKGRGKPKLLQLLKIADTFHVKMDFLLGLDDGEINSHLQTVCRRR